MQQVIGHQRIKDQLARAQELGRVAHAQLFVGPSGSGLLPLALAYARQLLCTPDAMGNCNVLMDEFSHPDLHFAFPTPRLGETSSSETFLKEWVDFMRKGTYRDLTQWLESIDAAGKNAELRVPDASYLTRRLSLKSHGGGRKVVIVWQADRMNVAAANKLLKIIEEPPQGTVLLLLAHNEDQLLNTITSRCQITYVPRLPEGDITRALVQNHGADPTRAKRLAKQSDGSFTQALAMLSDKDHTREFDQYLFNLIKLAVDLRTKTQNLAEITKWADALSKMPRLMQSQFLDYCIEIFRQAFLHHYTKDDLTYMEPSVPGFSLSGLSAYLSPKNFTLIITELERSKMELDRNINSKVLFTDMGITLGRYVLTA